jgi:hypothetical protein
MISRNLIQAVNEMLDRNWDVFEIASKLHLDISLVQSIIDIIQGNLL